MFHLEHIFINIRIKLPLERSWKYKMRKEGETHGPKLRKKKAPLNVFVHISIRNNTRAKHLLQYRKEKGVKQNHKEPPSHGKSPPMNAQNALTHNGTRFRCANRSLYIRNEIIYIYIYEYIKKTSSSDNNHLKINKKKTIWFIIFIIQKVQSVTSKENQWSKWLKLTVPVKAQCHNYKGLHFYSYRCCFCFFTFLDQWEQEQAPSYQFF